MTAKSFFILTACFVSLSILCSSCTEDGEDGKLNIEAYYYPVDKLTEPLVYEYRPVNNDTLGLQYWYFRTMKTDTATYFTSNIYNQFFEVEQFSIEELVSNGMLQKEYFLYTFDTTGTQVRHPAEIVFNNAFPFEVKDSSGVFLQEMKWTFSKEPLHTTTLVRNRRYTGKTEYTYKGINYDAVVFSVLEAVDDFYDGHLETKTSGVEIYAKGIGLVYQKKNISETLVLEYELSNTYSMEVLEQKFAKENQIGFE